MYLGARYRRHHWQRIEGAPEMKEADFNDDGLQISSGELPSAERPRELLSVGDGAILPGVDGYGASSLPSLSWGRQSSSSSSTGSSSVSEREIYIEHDNRNCPPQSELEEIPSRRWLSPLLTPRVPATPQLFPETVVHCVVNLLLTTVDKYVAEGVRQQEKKINHELHPHHTLKLECRGTPYKCDGCQELGFHSRYTCKEMSCSFHLHTECAEPRSSLSHPFFKNCSFRFLVGMAGRVCDACGMDVKGYVYHCTCVKCGKDLHPCCAKLECPTEDGGVKLVLKKEMHSKCYICDMKKVEGVSTWGYVSTCKTYSLHISCAKELVLKSWMKQTSFGSRACRRVIV